MKFANVTSGLALTLSVVAVAGPAAADSISEPDAYKVHNEVLALQDEVESLTDQVNSMATQQDISVSRIDTLEAVDVSPCIAFSDRHYVREHLNGSKKKYRMPLVVWRLDPGVDSACRPSSGPWKNRRLHP